MQFPHSYQSLNVWKVRKGGMCVHYGNNTLEKRELHDFINDPEETKSVILEHTEIVFSLDSLAEKARGEMGDALSQ